jgi:hypothetical protein
MNDRGGIVLVEDRDVEFRSSSIDPPGVAEWQITTYDADAGLYRQWVFDSDGYRHEAVGRWNAVTSTRRWDGRVDGASFVIDDHWVSRDRSSGPSRARPRMAASFGGSRASSRVSDRERHRCPSVR